VPSWRWCPRRTPRPGSMCPRRGRTARGASRGSWRAPAAGRKSATDRLTRSSFAETSTSASPRSSRSSASASAGRRMFFPVSPASVTISNVRRHTRSEGPAARWNRRSSTVRPRRQHLLTPPTARPLAVQQPTQRPAQRGLLNRSDPARPVASGPAGRRLARSRRFRQASGGYACARHRRVAGKPR